MLQVQFQVEEKFSINFIFLSFLSSLENARSVKSKFHEVVDEDVVFSCIPSIAPPTSSLGGEFPVAGGSNQEKCNSVFEFWGVLRLMVMLWRLIFWGSFGTLVNHQTLTNDSFMALKPNYDYSFPFSTGSF
ncbi:hypothetical protein MTR67_027829 [Solanum verrucosum]|uniref:Uncharacterized protein n=1 Tax=Solanum verrucosum TaxID=315347 RepID=A0AAF0RA99_SOLVR|nr:hypothetical protein MTR67_027829 [Solanum verrucosum]